VALPSKIKQMIGKSTAPAVFEVEKNQIRRFARAIGEESAIHFDEEAAKSAGYSGLVAPPTFAAVLDNTADLREELGLNPTVTMHAEEEYEYFREICAGDEITIVHRISDAYDKPAPKGRLIYIVLETRGADKKSRPVFKGRRILVELKQ